jgi:hypothetical protein
MMMMMKMLLSAAAQTSAKRFSKLQIFVATMVSCF